MLQLTETTLFHWDMAVDLSQRFYDPKTDFSGPNPVVIRSWVSKVETPGRRAGASTASNHSYVTTVANTEFTASSGSQPPVTTTNGLGYRRSDLESSDGGYREALMGLPKRSQ
jgi:hypothetical protein